MDVDSLSTSPQIEECGGSDSEGKMPKDKLLHLLDQVEAHVERLRLESLILEERRDTLFTTLDAIRNHELIHQLHEQDKDDIHRYIDRVSTRCTTVEILVRTDRDKAQEDALHQVNHLIDSLIINFKNDPLGTRNKCLTYMAACSSQSDVPSDKSFEMAVLGCTLDDQKKIKKRLQGLYNYIDENEKITPIFGN